MPNNSKTNETELNISNKCNEQDNYVKDIKKQLMKYMKENEKLENELRDFRHNVLNIMHSINGYIELENWDGLKKHFCNILGSIKHIDTNHSIIKKIENSPLKELLNKKLKKAEGLDIDFKLGIDQNSDIFIKHELISEIDLCQVIGILLDQAIEMALEAANKKVSIYFLRNGNFIDIIIENTFKEKPEISKLDAISSTLSKYPDILYNTFLQHQVFVHQIQVNNKL